MSKNIDLALSIYVSATICAIFLITTLLNYSTKKEYSSQLE